MGSIHRELALPVCLLIAILSIADGVVEMTPISCEETAAIDSCADSGLPKGSRLYSSDIASPQYKRS